MPTKPELRLKIDEALATRRAEGPASTYEFGDEFGAEEEFAAGGATAEKKPKKPPHARGGKWWKPGEWLRGDVVWRHLDRAANAKKWKPNLKIDYTLDGTWDNYLPQNDLPDEEVTLETEDPVWNQLVRLAWKEFARIDAKSGGYTFSLLIRAYMEARGIDEAPWDRAPRRWPGG